MFQSALKCPFFPQLSSLSAFLYFHWRILKLLSSYLWAFLSAHKKINIDATSMAFLKSLGDKMPVNWVPKHTEETQVSFQDWGTEETFEKQLSIFFVFPNFLLFLYFPIKGKGLDAPFPYFSLKIHFWLNFLMIFFCFWGKIPGWSHLHLG